MASSDTPPAKDKRVLGLRQVVALNVVAIISLRSLPTIARFGWGSLVLLAIAFAIFFVPLALAVVSLSARDPSEGGLYKWTDAAFGPAHGYVCGWSYYVTNPVYFTAILAHLAAVLPWLITGHETTFGASRAYVLCVTLGALWVLGFLPNLLGARRTGQISVLAMASVFVAIGILGLLAGLALSRGAASATPASTIVPSFRWGTLNFLSTLAFTLVGLELAPTMGAEIRDAKKSLVSGALIAGGLVIALMAIGLVTLSLGMTAKDIPLADGIPQAVAALAPRIGVSGAFVRAIAACLVISTVGSLVVWMAGIARLAHAAGVGHALPAWFAKESPRFGTPVGGLFAQTVAASLLIILGEAGSTARQAYSELQSMTALLTFLPYLYLFASYVRLAEPARRVRATIAGGLGFVVTLGSIAFTLVPSDEITNVPVFELKVIGGCALMVALGWPLYVGARRRAAAASTPTPARLQ